MSGSSPRDPFQILSAAPGFDERYTLPEIEPSPRDRGEVERLKARVRELKEARRAVILAHNYQRAEVQEIADFVGDSLGLSQQAAGLVEPEVIVFCGVHFMAETAAILCPDKTVLLPDLRAGCSLSSSITVDDLRAARAQCPDAVIVAYVNTSAEIKAESDYCCTSANAAAIVKRIPADRPILFLPDRYLGEVVARQTGRTNLVAYPGYCHVHKMIDPEHVMNVMDRHPDLELLLHPECGCVATCMTMAFDGRLPQGRVFFLSTEGMMRHIRTSAARVFAVGTEVGMLHRLEREFPDREFVPVNPDAICAFMKTITLPGVVRALETMSPRVTVPDEIARRARRAIERMLEVT